MLFLLVFGAIAVSFLLLGIGVWVKGKFPNTHLENNPHFEKLGIHCAKEESSFCGSAKSAACAGCALYKM